MIESARISRNFGTGHMSANSRLRPFDSLNFQRFELPLSAYSRQSKPGRAGENESQTQSRIDLSRPDASFANVWALGPIAVIHGDGPLSTHYRF